MNADDARADFTQALTQVLLEAEQETAALWIDGKLLLGQRHETRRTLIRGKERFHFQIFTTCGSSPETPQVVHLCDRRWRRIARPTRH